MWIADGVIIRREAIRDSSFTAARTVDYVVASLNRSRFEIEATRDEARTVVENETRLLAELGDADRDGDDDAFEAFIEDQFEAPNPYAELDIGVAGAVVALAAVGAWPLSSCNGGLLGGYHSSDVPHILFSCDRPVFNGILSAAEAVDCGLIQNERFIELFADDLTKLNAFARTLLGMETARSSGEI